MSKRLLTTGQAAELCSVTPDAVLKWIKAGKLVASRTAGGHYRVDPDDLERMGLLPIQGEYRYCWEHRAQGGDVQDVCRTCLVYRARAERCYEVAAVEGDQPGGHNCCVEKCEDCQFYRRVTGFSSD